MGFTTDGIVKKLDELVVQKERARASSKGGKGGGGRKAGTFDYLLFHLLINL